MKNSEKPRGSRRYEKSFNSDRVVLDTLNENGRIRQGEVRAMRNFKGEVIGKEGARK
jgi:hypothetical protein